MGGDGIMDGASGVEGDEGKSSHEKGSVGGDGESGLRRRAIL